MQMIHRCCESNLVSMIEFQECSRNPFKKTVIGKNPANPKKCRYLLNLRECTSEQQRRKRLQDLRIRDLVLESGSGISENPV